MVKSVLILGMAFAAAASPVLGHEFHGGHRNRHSDIKAFGPFSRSAAHHNVYASPLDVELQPLEGRHLTARHLRSRSGNDAELDDKIEIAAAYLSQVHGISTRNIKLKSAYRSEHTGVTHVYFKQIIHGVEVVNGDGNVNIDEHGRVISSGNSFASSQSSQEHTDGPAAHSLPSIIESAIKGSWEYMQGLAIGVLEETFSDISDGLDMINGFIDPIIEAAKHRLHLQDQDGDGLTIVDDSNPETNHNAGRDHRQHKFSPRDASKRTSSYIPVTDALVSLSHHIGMGIYPHQLANVDITAKDNIEGDPEVVLSGLPTRFAINGEASARPALLRLDDGTLSEIWDITVEQDEHWWSAQVDARTGKVNALVDWASNYASPEAFRVYPWQVPDPVSGERILVENPAHQEASPNGWVKSNQTAGNNVYAQSNPDGGYSWENNFRPTSQELVFDYPLDLSKSPSHYIEAAVTQLFYTNNFMHDLFFLYGFDEQAGNFQDENFSGKGHGNDAVVANAQDGSGYNNANFATPPDGRRPKMRMYVWDITSPYRDGDLEQGIVVHEYTHGISIRLTGGPANSNCLGWGESGGMGEGWGDIFATIIRLTENSTRSDDIPMGAYSASKGIRKYPYSTSMSVNPSTYGTMNSPAYWEVHAKGEVWAEIFYEVLWNLIDAHGFSNDLFSHDLTKGNVLALQLLVDGMKLQPCRPTFVDARDAILLADRQLTGGENQCLIWKGFSKRGLGPDADLDFDSPWGGGTRTEDFSLPRECRE